MVIHLSLNENDKKKKKRKEWWQQVQWPNIKLPKTQVRIYTSVYVKSESIYQFFLLEAIQAASLEVENILLHGLGTVTFLLTIHSAWHEWEESFGSFFVGEMSVIIILSWVSQKPHTSTARWSPPWLQCLSLGLIYSLVVFWP